MTKPRKQQISLEETPFYHCISRCVRRAYLCGFDRLTNRSYEHRRQQIQEDILRLASIFYIDVAAFAVMSDHYHVVLHVRRSDAYEDTPESIIDRMHQVVAGNDLSHRYQQKKQLEQGEHELINNLVEIWRSRLHDISWFMKFLNEGIARRANKEDKCTGHFWESRFKSQALLDEKAVLSAMAYVDLNPVRAGISATPEQSDYTSIQQRIAHWKSLTAKPSGELHPDETYQHPSLMPFVGNPREPMPEGIAMNLLDYIMLLESTGRVIRSDKRGFIDERAAPVLDRLDISPAHWIEICTDFEGRFKGLVGSIETVKRALSNFGLTRVPNLSNSRMLFSGYSIVNHMT